MLRQKKKCEWEQTRLLLCGLWCFWQLVWRNLRKLDVSLQQIRDDTWSDSASDPLSIVLVSVSPHYSTDVCVISQNLSFKSVNIHTEAPMTLTWVMASSSARTASSSSCDKDPASISSICCTKAKNLVKCNLKGICEYFHKWVTQF